MKCIKCGFNGNQTQKFCPVCGERLVESTATEQQPVQQPAYNPNSAQNYGQQPAYNPNPAQSYGQQPVTGNNYGYGYPVQQNRSNPMGARMSYKEFYKRFAPKKVDSNVIATMVFCAISIIASMGTLFTGHLISLVDILFFGTAVFALYSTRHWGAAAAISAYSGFWFLYSLFSGGIPAGILVVILAAYTAFDLKKMYKAYEEFIRSGTLPEGFNAK